MQFPKRKIAFDLHCEPCAVGIVSPVPKGLGQCILLEELNLDHNYLEELPEVVL